MRLARFLLLGSLLCTLVIFAARPQLPFAALANQETYATGYGVGQPFAAFFRAHGGVAIFGMPLGPVVDQGGGSVQYFERQRLEYHPEAAGSGREVQVGLLGYEVTEGRDFPAVEPFDDTDDARFYRVTGHSLRGQFLHYWQAYGGLPIFGYPISEPLRERSADDGREYTVQYFERARLELHPELAGSPHEVLLGRLGATLWERQAAGRGRLAADAAVSPATSPMFTVSTSVSPTTAKQGGTVSINIAVSNGSGKQMSATAALAVVDPLGNQAYTKTWAKQSFPPKKTVTLTAIFTTALNAPAGTWTAGVNLHSTDHSTSYYSDGTAATFMEIATTATPSPTATLTPAPTNTPAPTARNTPIPPTPTNTPAPTGTGTACCSPTPLPPTPTANPTGGYGTLLWADEFNGTSLDTSKWSYKFPWGAMWNHGGNELQCNRPSGVVVSNGTMKMTAYKHATAQPCESTTDLKLYDGALLASYPSFNASGVYAEARMRFPRGKSYWTGFWMSPSDQGWPPEIDAAESGGLNSATLAKYTANYHAYDKSQFQHDVAFPDDAETNWHTVGAYWSSSEVLFYFDGVLQSRVTYQPPTEQMYLLFNFAISGYSSDAPDSATRFPSPPLEVDYVRVWSNHP